MLISKSENHIILQKEYEWEMFLMGKLAGIANAGNLVEDGSNATAKLVIPEKDFTEALLKLLGNS